MNLIPSKETTKRALKSHSWIGIAISAFMYLICVSGTIAVVYPELERWEQPTVEEYLEYDINVLEQAYIKFVNEPHKESKHLYLVLPTEEAPRGRITTDEESFFINADGTRSIDESHPWTKLVTNLHLYLHLPQTIGLLVVSLMGVLLVALIVSGIMSHRRILKDAFSFRWNRTTQLQQTDLHNRLSVWGLPFHLMFGITGSFFGLALLFSVVFAQVYFQGDTQKVIEAVYGEEPELSQPIKPVEISKAFAHLSSIAPNATPVYITLEEFNSEKQFMLIGASHPNRLIFVEQYQYDVEGNYLGNIGYLDGELGRQAIFSVYRLHFGHFGSFAVKIIYIIMGVAISIISATGINIWLTKRKHTDYLNHLWTAIVWGTPLSLSLCAISSFALGIISSAMFWLILLSVSIFTLWRKNHLKSKKALAILNAVAIGILVLLHSVLFGINSWTGGSLIINLLLLIAFLSFVFLFIFTAKKIKLQTRIYS